MRAFYILIVAVLGWTTLVAQPPTGFFTKFGGDGDEVAFSGKQILDGNYIVVGSSTSYGTNGITDLFLLKVDQMGKVLWTKFIGGTNVDVGKSIIQLSDSGFVIAGYTNSKGNGGYDAYLVRTDKIGHVLWERTFGGSDWDFASDLVLSADGNIAMVGHTYSFGNGKKDGFIVKYDTMGNVLWEKFFGGKENDELKSIINTNDGMLVVAGFTESKSDINGDAYFVKLSQAGDTLFTRTIGGPFKDYANDVIQKGMNEYFLVGATTLSANAKTSSVIWHTTASGLFISDTSFRRSSADEEYISVANSKHDNYLNAYLKNAVFPNNKQQSELLICYTNGVVFEVNASGGAEEEAVYSVESTEDGGYLVVGSTLSFESAGRDIWFVKHDSAVINYSSAMSVRRLESKNITVIRYDKNSITIDFATMSEKVVLTDIAGRVLKREVFASTTGVIDISDLPSGLFLVTVENNSNQKVTRKIVR